MIHNYCNPMLCNLKHGINVAIFHNGAYWVKSILTYLRDVPLHEITNAKYGGSIFESKDEKIVAFKKRYFKELLKGD